jgi:hypothetical protein
VTLSCVIAHELGQMPSAEGALVMGGVIGHSDGTVSALPAEARSNPLGWWVYRTQVVPLKRARVGALVTISMSALAALVAWRRTGQRHLAHQQPLEVSSSEPKRGSVASGLFWMTLLSLLLFWLPVIGPFIAGLVGGKKAGGIGQALTAVFLPSLLFGATLFVVSSAATGLPVVGAIAAIGGIALALAHVGPLLLGAIIGGLLA